LTRPSAAAILRDVDADVLIVTAVAEEHAAVLAVETATHEGVTLQDFEGEGGALLRVAVVQALGMGGAQAAIASAGLVEKLGVRCLAMCGVCAGRRGDVALGDVIIADRVWEYGAGKRKAEGAGEARVVREEEDVEMFRLHPPAWKLAAERFAVDPGAGWLAERPRSYEAQGDWVLERVLAGVDPVTAADSKAMCADLDKVLARLWKKKLLKKDTLTLTAAGRHHIEQVLLVHRRGLPEAMPFKVHVGPIASGRQVMQDDEVFATTPQPGWPSGLPVGKPS
jgi:Phosphorylase superfamily